MDTQIENIVEDNELPAQQSQRKAEPAKGKRYSPAQRREILAYAKTHTVRAAADKFDTTETSIYEWRRANKRRGKLTGGGENEDASSERLTEDPKEERDRRVLAMWQQSWTSNCWVLNKCFTA